MAKRTHTSAKGEQIDFDLLHTANKDTIAVGNGRMNAAGDRLGKGGEILKTAEQITKIQQDLKDVPYNDNVTDGVKMVSLKDSVDDLSELVKDDVKTKEVPLEDTNVKQETSKKKTNTRKLVDTDE